MAESPDREIAFGRGANANEFEDANETLEEPQGLAQNRGGGDSAYRSGFLRDSPRRTPHAVTVKPEPYDGTDDWEEYITQFEVCAELGNWRDIDKALTLASALRGPARTFYISLPQIERRNFGILTQRLGARFGSSTQDSRWLSRLETRKRTQGESVAALADDLRQMAQRAYKDFDPRAQEVLALNQLYKSVTPDIKYQCRDCKTMSEAVEIIERYEAIMADSNDKRKTVRLLTTGADAQCYTPEEEADTLQGLNRRMAMLESDRENTRTNANDSRFHMQQSQAGPRRQTTGKFKGKCYICKSPNHFFSKCPIYIKCQKEMNGSQPITGADNTNRDSGNKSYQYKNQGNFSTPLTH